MSEEIISFGPFRFSPTARTLDRDGEPLNIGGRALDILAVLIERAGEVVTHRELMAKVWRDLVVDSGNLRVNIAQLRRVLGDAGALIQSIPRQGYRFVAPIFRSGRQHNAEDIAEEMQAMLDCNYGLLPEDERLVLCRLAIFAGTFTLDAARFVACDADVAPAQLTSVIARLAAKSLLTISVAADGSPRYRIRDITRAYARARLEQASEAASVAHRHARYFSLPLDVPGEEPLGDARAALQWCLQRDEFRAE